MYILYRGKVNNDMWVYGLPTYDKDRKVSAIEDISGRIYYVASETIGQCISIKDKNKKWIFEGDIVNCYGGEQCQGNWEYNKNVIANFDDYIAIMTIAESEYIEIIGNIYDNPELLKGE